MPDRRTGQWPRSDRAFLLKADSRARRRAHAIRLLGEIALLRCLRAHLQETVCQISPLVFDVLAGAGLALDDVLHDLRPGPAWLRRRGDKVSQSLPFHRDGLGRSAGDLDPLRDHHFDWLDQAQAIAMVRPRSHGAGYAGIRVVGRAVEVIDTIGDCTLSTQGGTAWLTLGDRLPEALAIGCVGRQASDLVESPMFAGRHYLIREIFETAPPRRSSVLVVDAGLAGRTMPWPELLRCEPDGG